MLRFGRLARPIASARTVSNRTLSISSVLRDERPPNLKSSFDSRAPNLRSSFAGRLQQRELPLPVPGWYRYSPWSDAYQGSLKSKILFQTLFYAFLIAQVSNYVDSTFFPPASEDTPPKYASPAELRIAIQKLRTAFPDKGSVDTTLDVLKTTGSSENSYHPASPHSVVVRVKSTEDVVKVVNIAREFKVPITAYSGATSLEGQFSGFPSGSICLDLSGMDQILHINEADSDLICQSGARWEDINQTLKDKGIPLFFPLDPGPGATIGGMVGTGCSGTNAVRYGTAKAEWFLNLTVVLPSGEVIKTRRRARKSSAGFDTTKLFIGAEGTLGIVTEATLRLAPVIPTKVAMAQFPSVEHAVNAVQEILNSPYGAHVQCVELLDDLMMDALNNGGLSDHTYPVQDTLFFKLQGDDPAIKLTSKTIQALVKKHGSTKFEFASTDEEAETLWQNRKYALMSTMAAHPESRCWTTDVCVPVSRLPQLVSETKKDLADAGLKSTIVGHVGDGNFHALILFSDDKELELVSQAVHRLVHRALALDGTCTGEHGVGVGKKVYLVEELGQGTVDLMKRIKKTVDPLNIMNPSKLYPD
ncbi:D-lactate dehydrogenase cytochrome oxidoreductase [Mycena rosella]|uniref:D-lactate dehydrogenase (cytochrome) n=1 Tax=Mycena rosella TaxID=1033263 RepID=A0AAD7E0D5_MYCRO|nr:D-lactate dehydrogenase cytochrome oxidoreductase [Mycena rosella]